jgi:hypothetical protein
LRPPSPPSPAVAAGLSTVVGTGEAVKQSMCSKWDKSCSPAGENKCSGETFRIKSLFIVLTSF